MSAGKPDWAKLYEMGKLPKSARGNVPMLQQLDAAEKRIKELEVEVAKLRGDGTPAISVEAPTVKLKTIYSEEFTAPCEFEGCNYVAKGKSEAQVRNIILR